MSDHKFSKELIEKLKTVTGKRSRVVVDHILKHGFITTEDLEKTYGYNHSPRAARDVREQGIPLTTFQVKSSDGRTIAAYKFGDLSRIVRGRLGGRRVFSKEFKDDLFVTSEGRCAVCVGKFEKRYLQIDHRTPYEIAGDIDHLQRDSGNYMLLCGECNRAKSWSCEHCPNWTTKSSKVCERCYWAYPQNYQHIALREVRRTDILWDETELDVYETLKRKARESNYLVPEFVKKVIEACFKAEEGPD